MIYFDCGAETCLPRVLQRGKTSGRMEDNEAMFMERYERFMAGSRPLLEHFESQGLLDTVSREFSLTLVSVYLMWKYRSTVHVERRPSTKTFRIWSK